MKTPIVLLLGAAFLLTPAAVLAQAEASPATTLASPTLLAELCASVADDDSEMMACIATVEAALVGLGDAALPEGADLQERAQALADETGTLIDDALGELLEIDVAGAIDDVMATVNESDLEQALEEAVRALGELGLDADLDVRAVLDEAVGDAMASVDELDIGAAIEDAVAEANVVIGDAEVQVQIDAAIAAVADRVADARSMVNAAQTWARENPGAVCLGSSLGLGATVGLAVVAVTGMEPLGLQAFRSTEQFTNDLCADVLG